MTEWHKTVTKWRRWRADLALLSLILQHFLIEHNGSVISFINLSDMQGSTFGPVPLVIIGSRGFITASDCTNTNNRASNFVQLLRPAPGDTSSANREPTSYQRSSIGRDYDRKSAVFLCHSLSAVHTAYAIAIH